MEPSVPDTPSTGAADAGLHLEATLDQLADGLVLIDREWRYTYLNRAAEQYMRLTSEQIVGRTLWELFPDAATNDFGEPMRRAMKERTVTYVRAYHSALELWLETRIYPTADGIAVHLRDVSDIERQQRELDDAVDRALRMTALLDISNEAFITEDLDYHVTYWNRGAEQIYGWTREEAVGRDIRTLIYDEATHFEKAAAELASTGRWSGELHQRAKDGRRIVVACRWQAVLDEQGRPSSYFAVNSDITSVHEQREVESRARRLESLGTLAGGIAHDLNNVLTPVLMSVQLLKTMTPSPEQAELLEGMQSAIIRGADMISQVLSFARGVEGARDLVQARALIDELRKLTLAVLPKSIEVVIVDDEVPPMIGDATQILQVIVNLVTNARDAMPDGGTLTISLREQTVHATSTSRPSLSTGRHVAIAVADSGGGMSDEIVGRIFDPFFTTKGVGEGTGLGLSSSLAIARSHGGDLTVASELGSGSVFTLLIPAADSSSLDDKSAGTAEDAPLEGRGRLVLVIDDEENIRSIVSQTLERHGYRTVQAQNGRDAISVMAAHGDDVALVLTDMMMPVMDGAAVASYLREHHPAVAVVASSGLNAAAAVERARGVGVRHFIPKPFTTETLMRALRDALNE